METCDRGALTIDVDQDSPRTGQVVIRDRAIVDHLVSRGVIEERFGQRTADKRDYPRGFGYQGSVGREGGHVLINQFAENSPSC